MKKNMKKYKSYLYWEKIENRNVSTLISYLFNEISTDLQKRFVQ